MSAERGRREPHLCGVPHGLSRSIHEEGRFDTEKVTSRDWVSHPTLRPVDVPERVDIVLVNEAPNPNVPTGRPTEPARLPGYRMRRVPFRDERVIATLKAAGV